MDVVDVFLHLSLDRVPPMKSAGKGLCAAGCSRCYELTEPLLELDMDACAPSSATESVGEAILRFPDCPEVRSVFLDTRLGMATRPTFLFGKAKGSIKTITFMRAKHFVSTTNFFSHLKPKDVVRFLVGNRGFGSIKPSQLSDREPSRSMAMTCGLCMDHGASGKGHSKVKFVCQPGGKGFDVPTRKCCCCYCIRECLAAVLTWGARGKVFDEPPVPLKTVLETAPTMGFHSD
jgi:hypothetical protein